jgi:hypothetical protein
LSVSRKALITTFASGRRGTCSEIWDSREHFEAFGERLRLMPVLAELGIEFSGPPEIFEVHKIVKR